MAKTLANPETSTCHTEVLRSIPMAQNSQKSGSRSLEGFFIALRFIPLDYGRQSLFGGDKLGLSGIINVYFLYWT